MFFVSLTAFAALMIFSCTVLYIVLPIVTYVWLAQHNYLKNGACHILYTCEIWALIMTHSILHFLFIFFESFLSSLRYICVTLLTKYVLW